MIILMILCWIIGAFISAALSDYLMGDIITDKFCRILINGVCIVFWKYLIFPLIIASGIKYIVNSLRF